MYSPALPHHMVQLNEDYLAARHFLALSHCLKRLTECSIKEKILDVLKGPRSSRATELRSSNLRYYFHEAIDFFRTIIWTLQTVTFSQKFDNIHIV